VTRFALVYHCIYTHCLFLLIGLIALHVTEQHIALCTRVQNEHAIHDGALHSRSLTSRRNSRNPIVPNQSRLFKTSAAGRTFTIIDCHDMLCRDKHEQRVTP